MERIITGTMFSYYFICKRKLWYFAHRIEMEAENEDVQIGKEYDAHSFKREKHHRSIEGIDLDFIVNGQYVHEIKKAHTMPEAAKAQVKFYLYKLHQAGIPVREGVIHYMENHVKETVYFSLDDVKYIQHTLADIQAIIDRPSPPAYEPYKFCSKCAYYELCAM